MLLYIALRSAFQGMRDAGCYHAGETVPITRSLHA